MIKKIKFLQDDIRIIQNNDPVKANELSREIEVIQLENINLKENLPADWKQLNNEYELKYSEYSKLLSQYYKSSDDGYKILKDLKEEIENTKPIDNLILAINVVLNDLEKLDKDSKEQRLNQLLELSDSIQNIGNVGDLIYETTTKLDDQNTIVSLLNESKIFLDSSIAWKKIAFTRIYSKLLDYDNLLKDSIGLRSQNRLNKDQALEVARCNSNHRDIALRF